MLARGFDDLDVAGAFKSQDAQGAKRSLEVNAFRPRRLIGLAPARWLCLPSSSYPARGSC
jgi:hypothetical protein